MQICYIPAIAVTTQSSAPNFIEQAIGNAIQHTIVDPFQSWCNDIWCAFVDVSLPVCTIASLAALIFALIGVKRAKQWVIIPMIVYLFIQMANYLMGVSS